MVQSKRFTRLKGSDGETSPNLYVANCGPAVGLSFETIASLFGRFGEVRGVSAADESGARVIVSYFEPASAQSALKALHGHPCPDLGGRLLHIRYSVLEQHPQPSKVPTDDSISVSSVASELGIPGIHLVHDFITADEEQTRNVDAKQFLGELPLFVSPILEKISLFSNPESVESNIVDQLTVNEYPFGVGLSPHIDTHSAFEGSIFSLSLAGPCIMELRKYPQGTWLPLPSTSIDVKGETSECSNFIRRAIFLPPRSMLSLSGEARYAWHHYIPHHKIDIVGGRTIKRNSRRVSFTLRKVRNGPCYCEFPQYCDSRKV
ncbi:alkylated DNA repair protein ALKBH8 homolog isoform X3 [Magnolia sinica]|uniref:alkylated DNA repair protein ALKBH8 homolog isoform X3 n=1 Tax=Magnolia sinica TaxID=86752 RepID=UPI002658CDCD|nr:alkylated DNA repair protein ALKBH8 homolog isoform X3 [Magnolia sinica]